MLKFRKNTFSTDRPRLPRTVTIDIGGWLKKVFPFGRKRVSTDESKLPQIVRVEDGFKEFFPDGEVGEVLCRNDGSCVVYFRDGAKKEVKVEYPEYSSIYGIHFSRNGHTLFNISWEKGVIAYDVLSGTKLWHFKSAKISKLFVYETYVVVRKYGEAIIKLDISTGNKLAELRSSTIEGSWRLDDPYILVNWFRGKLSVIDTETMTIYKQYSKQIENPTKAIRFMIVDGFLKKNRLIIKVDCGSGPFEHMIDSELLSK